MQQQGFDGIAGCRVLRLAIDSHGDGLIQVHLAIDIQMAYAIGVPQHRNPGVVLNELHQGIGSPGDDQIHQSFQLEQRQALFPTGEQRQDIGMD